MAGPPGRRRRVHGPRARRRAEERARALRARARLERVLPRAPRPAHAAETADAAADPSHDLGAPDAPDGGGQDESAEPYPSPPRLSRRAVAGVVLVALVGVVAVALHLLRAGPATVDLPAPVRSAPPSARATATVMVDVAGAVRRPGVYRLPAGSRVGEALARAGGPAPGAETSSLNLARVLADGEQVLVPLPGAGAAPGGGPGSAAGSGGALVDLNSATLDQLEALPGVGPVLAQRILDWRREHGRFSSVDELREVSGVGERKFADLKPRVRV